MYEPPPWKKPDDIVELAERTDGPLPKGGIPKQKVPGWIRWPIRALFLPFVLLDLASAMEQNDFIPNLSII
jgi:hypothetical protein